jgi:hypothetical protein
MKTHVSTLKTAALLTLATLCFLASPALAAMEEVIGSWRRADNSIVEFRPDGSVFSKDTQIGTWQKLKDSRQYTLRINGAMGYYFKTWVSEYQRKLTMQHSSTGTKTTIDRVDNGPTANPDVPDEKAAMELEFTDLEISIESAYERLSKVQAEAAEARQKHEYARAIGRISAWLPIAQKKEAEANNIAAGIKTQKRRLTILETKLGKKADIAEPAPVNSNPAQPGFPPGAFPPGTFPPGTFPPGTFPPGTFPPGMYPPGIDPRKGRPQTGR